MLASGGGHPECVKLLLAAKANVNDIEDEGRSVLFWACENDESGPRTEVIKLLIEAKADVNQSDENGRTALMKACDHGNEAAVKLLIEANANIDSADKSGVTALMCAIHHPRIVKLLIEAKADVNRANSDGYTALMYAYKLVSKGCLATVKLLLAVPGIDIDHVSSKGDTALSLAKAPNKGWESEEALERRLSVVPLLEEKMRQQVIDAEVAAAVKRIDAGKK
jgi:ankyrin repeat protein